MSRRSARLALFGVVALLVIPAGAMGVGASAAPMSGQQLPTGLPDLPVIPGDEEPTAEPSASESQAPIDLPTGLPLPTEAPSGLPTVAPTDVAAVQLPSVVWISRVKQRFIGAVTSAQPLCQPGRTVIVKRIVDGKARNIGKAETGPDATWAMSKITTKPGRYFAQVKPMTLEIASCLGDRSETRRIKRR